MEMMVEDSVMKVLERCKVDGKNLFLPAEQLERKMYEKVNKVLSDMGGKWNRSVKAHVFPDDVAGLLEQVLDTGEVTSLKKELQYFFTPDFVVDMMIKKMKSTGVYYKILEPSAGEGAIALKLKAAGFEVEVCEKHAPFREKLAKDGFKVLPEDDFLNVKAVGVYDAVVANPPFSKQADVDHVNHMLDVVRKGGAVISVMSSGATFRENRKTQDFKDRLKKECSLWEFERLPEGAFKRSGTMVNSMVLMAVKK